MAEADQRQGLHQVLQATKDAADSAIRTRDGEIASLQFIAEQAHSQRSPSETDTYREVQELRGEVWALRSELASSYCAHSDAQVLRQELAASEGLMSEMLAEFQAQLQGHILDHGEKMNKITMAATQYVEQLGQNLELELAAYETKLKGGQRYLARARQELRDGHSERGSLMGKIAASASEPLPCRLLRKHATLWHDSELNPLQKPSRLHLLAYRSPNLSWNWQYGLYSCGLSVGLGQYRFYRCGSKDFLSWTYLHVVQSVKAMTSNTMAVVTTAHYAKSTGRHHLLITTT